MAFYRSSGAFTHLYLLYAQQRSIYKPYMPGNFCRFIPAIKLNCGESVTDLAQLEDAPEIILN